MQKYVPGFVNAIKKDIKLDVHLTELLKGSSSALVLKFGGTFLGFVVTVLISRFYGASALGLFTMMMTILQIASIVSRTGTDTALIKFVAAYDSNGEPERIKDVYIKATFLTLGLSVLVSLILFLTADFWADIVFQKPHYSYYIKIGSLLVFPFSFWNLNFQALRGKKKIGWYTFLFNVSIYLFCFLLLSAWIFVDTGMSIPTMIYFVAVVLAALLSAWAWLNNSRIMAMSRKFSMSLKSLIRISFPMMLAASLPLLNNWTSFIFLGMYEPDSSVGIFNAVVRVSSFTSVTLLAINSIAAPKFAEFYSRNDMRGLQKIVSQATKLIFWTSVPILLAFILFPSFVLSLFGKSFSQMGAAVLIMLSIGKFVNSWCGSVGYILQMTDQQTTFQNILFAGWGLNILLNFLLVPPYGLWGAGIASMVAIIFWNTVSAYFVKRNLGILTVYNPFS